MRAYVKNNTTDDQESEVINLNEAVQRRGRVSEIPPEWNPPQFTFGQRVQLASGVSGVIVGLEYATPNSYLARRIALGWHYIVNISQNYCDWLNDEEERRAKEADLQLMEKA